MQKVLSIIMVFTLLFFTCTACSTIPDDWQTVELKDYGTIQFPKEWELTKKDGLYYVFDESSKPVMIQWCDTNLDGSGSNEYYNNYVVGKLIFNKVYSNSTQYGSYEVTFDNEIKELLYLSISNGNYDEPNMDFIVWNKNVELETVKNIAKSFLPSSE